MKEQKETKRNGQHAEALQLIQDGMKMAPITFKGEIPLTYKQYSPPQLYRIQQQKLANGEDTKEGKEEEDKEFVCVSSRGVIEPALLDEFVGIIEEGYNGPHGAAAVVQREQEEQAAAIAAGSSSNSPSFSFLPVIVVVVAVYVYCKYYGGGSMGVIVGIVLAPAVLSLQGLLLNNNNNNNNKSNEQSKQKGVQNPKAITNSAQITRRTYTAADIKSETNLWDEANAYVNNVSLWRSLHDDSGVGKIVLIFCDSFLTKVLEMPFWHARPDIQMAMKPIMELLNVQLPHEEENEEKKDDDNDNDTNKSIIVRMQIASLPPGGTIGVHYDTFEWVKYSHRVHVPLIVKEPQNIMFRVGTKREQLQRVNCQKGHVFELNNQCFHAVDNCSSDSRVHLILDIVRRDDLRRFREQFCNTSSAHSMQLPRYKLEPSEQLFQTGKSIDRLCERGTRTEVPYYCILGAHASFGKFVYENLTKHPLVNAPVKMDTHALDWNWPTHLSDDDTDKIRTHLQNKFFQYEDLQYYPSLVVGDYSSSYLLDSARVIPRMKQVFPWEIKFLVVLRDPVLRAFQHYAGFVKLKKWNGKTFRDLINEDLYNLQTCGLIPYWDIETGDFSKQKFQAFVGSSEETQAWNTYLKTYLPLKSEANCLVSRGLYELNLRPWFHAFSANNDSNKDPFLILHADDMAAQPQGGEQAMNSVWKHLCIPEVDTYVQLPNNAAKQYEAIDPTIRSYLQTFYKAHNEQLMKILRQERPSATSQEWKGWDY